MVIFQKYLFLFQELIPIINFIRGNLHLLVLRILNINNANLIEPVILELHEPVMVELRQPVMVEDNTFQKMELVHWN